MWQHRCLSLLGIISYDACFKQKPFLFLGILSWPLFHILSSQGLFGRQEFLYQTRFFRQLFIYLCGQMILDQICSNIILLLGGFNTNNMNMVRTSFPKQSLELLVSVLENELTTAKGWRNDGQHVICDFLIVRTHWQASGRGVGGWGWGVGSWGWGE